MTALASAESATFQPQYFASRFENVRDCTVKRFVIADYVVEDHADRVLASLKTRHEAITGLRSVDTSPTSPGFDTSVIRKIGITGARLNGCGRRGGRIP